MNYAFCDDMYVHDPPQASVSRSLAAQTVDGNLRVRAPGFRPSAFPSWVRSCGLTTPTANSYVG